MCEGWCHVVVGSGQLLSALIGTLSNLLTALAIIGGFIVLRPAWLWSMLGANRRRAFRALGSGNPTARKHRQRARDSSDGTLPSPQEEVAWWLRVGSDDQTHRPPGLLAALRARPESGPETTGQFLARGYSQLARQLNSRLLLGSAVPVVAAHAALATSTAAFLRHLAPAFEGKLDQIALGHDAAGEVALRWPSGDRQISFHAYPGKYEKHYAFELLPIYTPDLLFAPYDGMPARDEFESPYPLVLDREESEMLSEKFHTEHVFDGVLPRLTKAHSTRDAASGRQILVAEFSAMTYGAVIAEHYPGKAGDGPVGQPAPDRGVLRARGIRRSDAVLKGCGLLTLSMAPVTRDGYVLFVQRSMAAGSHEGAIGPAVNGNLEMTLRRDGSGDFDQYGTPEPLQALAREGREEIGLDIDPSSIDCLGLTTFSTPTEKVTHCLLTTSSLGASMAEVVNGMNRASTLEGRWEVGSRFVGMQLPVAEAGDLDQQYRSRARWLMSDDALTPHAVATGLAVLAAHAQGRVRLVDLIDGGSDAATSDRRDWLVTVHL